MGNVIESCGVGADSSYLCGGTSSNPNTTNNSNNSNNTKNTLQNGNDDTNEKNSNTTETGDHMTDDAMISALLMTTNAFCGFANMDLCDANTLKKLTMARTAQSRFLVEHKMDSQDKWLLSQVKVFEVMAQNSSITSSSLLDSSNLDSMDDENDDDNKNVRSNEEKNGPNTNSRGVLGRYYASDEGAHAKDSSNSILRVTMRANFSKFYHEVYLSRFPQHVIQKGSAQAKTVDFLPYNLDADHNDLNNTLSLRDAMSYESDQRTNDSPRTIRFSLSRSIFMNLCIQGSLGLVTGLQGDATGSVMGYQGSPARGNNGPSQKQLVLLDRSTRSPIAVCTLRSRYGPHVVQIHSPNPNIYCQAPSAGIKFEGRALYPWAEFRVEGEFPLPVRYSIALAIGNDRFEDEPSYRASHLKMGSPDISVVGKTDTESSLSGCAIITLGNGSKPNDRFYISIAKGVDPSLFLCLAAIVDEMLEHTMRLQYLHSKKDSVIQQQRNFDT